MTHLLRRVVPILALALGSGLGVPAQPATATDRDLAGPVGFAAERPRAMPSDYAWLNGDTYQIVSVRGMTPRQALRVLGDVRRDLGPRTPGEAEGYLFNRFDSWPTVVQVDRRGPATVIYLPYNFLETSTLERLSRRGTAASFLTTVELDTYSEVARDGALIRSFDAGFRPPRENALRAERGLDWGARDQNVFATAWAFNERLSGAHLSEEWFVRDHPTYVIQP